MVAIGVTYKKQDRMAWDSSRDEARNTEDILEWITDLPLSKPVKNLPRDFSDAVLMSEVIKFYYPHLVISHYYIPGNSIKNKRENWETLNRRVLDKINMHLAPETIDALVHSQNGVIEKLLSDFRDKQMTLDATIKESEFKVFDVDAGPSNHDELPPPPIRHRRPHVYTRSISQEAEQPYQPGLLKRIFFGFFRILFAIICFWRWFSSSAPSEPAIQIKSFESDASSDEEDNLSLRENYAKALQELRVKSDVIKTLCHKVAFLEGSLKLKESKIASLTSQIQELNTGSIISNGEQVPARFLAHTNCSKAKRRSSLDKKSIQNSTATDSENN